MKKFPSFFNNFLLYNGAKTNIKVKNGWYQTEVFDSQSTNGLNGQGNLATRRIFQCCELDHFQT